MAQGVLDFICRRWHMDSGWKTGNCYWFAKILTCRFPSLRIYYLPIEGHFIAGDPIFHIYYDWDGLCYPNEEPIDLEELADTDPAWYWRLMRDCRD